MDRHDRAHAGARARVFFNRTTREAVLIASGHAVFHLPPVPPGADVRTFAVTLEPTGGVPSPTGPMVPAGAVS